MTRLLPFLLAFCVLSARAQMTLVNGTLRSYSSSGSGETPPVASCATNISILPGSTDYWAATNHSQGIALTTTTNVCRLYVMGDTHNASDRPIYAQIRTAKNGGGTQIGGNSTTNTLTAGEANVVELVLPETLPAPTGDYFINICSADEYNVNLTYSLLDAYGGEFYYASSDAVDRVQDLWMIVCYQ